MNQKEVIQESTNSKSILSTYLGRLYETKLKQEIKEELKLTNIMCVPKLKKIVISAGCGKFHKDEAKIKFVFEQIKALSGQLPVISKAHKSIAGFSIREGMTSGVFVTLRKGKMYAFLDRLIVLAMPKLRGFNGISLKSFDKHGNLNFGIPMHDVFLESNDEQLFGMNISIETSTNNDMYAQVLLEKLGIPFEQRSKS